MPALAQLFAVFVQYIVMFSPAIGITFSSIESRLAHRKAMLKFDRKKGNVATEAMHREIATQYEAFLKLNENGTIAQFRDLDFNA